MTVEDVSAAEAAKETLEFVLKRKHWNHIMPPVASNPTGMSFDHMVKILEEVAKGNLPVCKAHRYLGWAQATACYLGIMTLDISKETNRRCRT